MAYYRLVTKTTGALYTGGMPGIYQGKATVAEVVSDAEGIRRHLADERGALKPGWVWHPGPVPRRRGGEERKRPPHPRTLAERRLIAKEIERRRAHATKQKRNTLGLFSK